MSYRKARTERDKIKLMTYIQYIQQCYREKKQTTTKKLKCVNYATRGRVFTARYGLSSYIKQALFVFRGLT